MLSALLICKGYVVAFAMELHFISYIYAPKTLKSLLIISLLITDATTLLQTQQ